MSGNGSTNCLSLPSIITAHKRGKVMFLHLSVILFTRGGESLSRGEGSLSRGEGSLSRGEGSLSRGEGSLSRGEGSLSGGGSLSRGRGLCPAWWGLCPGGGVSVQGDPCAVKCGQYASYWNAFLLNFNHGSKSNSSWEYDSQKTDMILMLSYFNYSLFCATKNELFLFGKSNSIKEAAAPSSDYYQQQYWVSTNVRCFFPPTIVVIVII